MDKRKWVILAGIVLLAIIGWIYSPYYEKNDAEKTGNEFYFNLKNRNILLETSQYEDGAYKLVSADILTGLINDANTHLGNITDYTLVNTTILNNFDGWYDAPKYLAIINYKISRTEANSSETLMFVTTQNRSEDFKLIYLKILSGQLTWESSRIPTYVAKMNEPLSNSRIVSDILLMLMGMSFLSVFFVGVYCAIPTWSVRAHHIERDNLYKILDEDDEVTKNFKQECIARKSLFWWTLEVAIVLLVIYLLSPFILLLR